MKMPFGKHKGVEVRDVPHSYLSWVLDNIIDLSPTLRRAIRHELGLPPEYEYRPPPPPPPVSNWGQPGGVPILRVRLLVLDAIKKWHRTQATRNHPDRGGDVRVMQTINSVADDLTKEITAIFDAAG